MRSSVLGGDQWWSTLVPLRQPRVQSTNVVEVALTLTDHCRDDGVVQTNGNAKNDNPELSESHLLRLINVSSRFCRIIFVNGDLIVVVLRFQIAFRWFGLWLYYDVEWVEVTALWRIP